MTERTEARWKVIGLAAVRKKLAELPRTERERIVEALEALEINPHQADLKPLQGRKQWRLRVGKWRIILRIDRDNLVMVALKLAPRGDVYK